MLRNYLKLASRNLWKHRVFSAINIVGLAIGIAACLLILQYVSFELSYDQFNKNADNIYRVVNDRYQNNKLIQHGTITYSGVSTAMQNDYPEIVNHTRVLPQGERIIINAESNVKISGQKGFAVEQSFLDMFDYAFVSGKPASALKEPRSIAISVSLARALFKTRNIDAGTILGTSVRLQSDGAPFTITGVFEDVPLNSHLQFDFLTSYNTVYEGWQEAKYNFTISDFWHYIQLKPGTDVKKLASKLPAFSEKYFQGNKVSGSVEKFYLQPLSEAHLYSDFEYEIGKTGSGTVVWGLFVISLFIICIAWVNYVTLTTARSVDRAREVGIRKVIGGTKMQLITQFMTESVLINLVSILLALVIVLIMQPSFNDLLQNELSLSYIFTRGLSGYSILFTLIAIILTGIIVSGLYPSFVLSSFQPILVLKGKLSSGKKGVAFRKGLVIGQFSITVVLIVCSIVVIQQLKYINNKDLGFNMDQVLLVKPPVLTEWDSSFIGRMNSFKESIKQLASVKGAASSWNVPGGDIGRSFNVRQASAASETKITVRHSGIDYDFMNVYGIKLLAGRNFTPTDHNPDFSKLQNLIINATASKMLGFNSYEEALGKTIVRGDEEWTVVGVVADHHQKSLQHVLEPIIFMPAYSTNSTISVKLNPENTGSTIAAIEKIYLQYFPGNLFEYSFLDERFNRQYQNEQLFGKAFSVFAVLAIMIACLGLFGLVIYSTIQRTKEIGIRKVLGASAKSIVVLLCRDFLALVIVAAFIAFPIAWWMMNRWLNDFAFKIDISWQVFAFAGILALLIAFFTVSLQAIRAANSNLVNSLRTD
ncbi:MAG TPA: ABC transporter permease [Chitinophagaceae bacterium]|nr:ABC transporter permease [Chitinophagaceae bacterium]